MTSPALDQVPVLVVDDDAHLLRTLHDILKLRGYAPLTAGSGRVGLRIAEELAQGLAVALVDLRLPDMDGLEVVERLHALSGLTEVIILTGHASLDTAVQALRKESFDYLVKPVQPESLLQTLRGATDRWQRRLVEQRLLETEERFRLLVENISDMILVVATDGTIRYASPSSKRIMGLEAPEIVGTRLADHLHPDERASMDRLLGDGRPGDGALSSCEHRLRRRDGSWLPVESTLNDLRHEPMVEGVVVASRDVADRKQLEAELLHSRKMESIGRLAGGVAHDFNNLLTVILGATSVVMTELEPGSGIADPLGEVLRAAERAADLTRQLLAFSRQQILQPQVLDLNGMVRQAERLLRRVIAEHIELRTVLAPELWPVRADPTQIEQVLMNLSVNASDAMPSGGRLTIRTSRAPGHRPDGERRAEPGDYVMIEVSDTGEGIRPEVQDRIFEPFFTTKELGKGTGLGLATVHGIVEQSGGHLRVSSEVGRGTTFQVFLPRSPDPAAAEHRPAPRTVAPSGSETILVVEDEPQVRDLVAAFLTSRGYDVLEVATAEEALDLLEGPKRVDLLLTDVVLPGISGVALAGRVRRERPGVRVLFTTGYAEQAVAPGGAGEDGMSVLQKPFTPEQLLRGVRSALDR